MWITLLGNKLFSGYESLRVLRPTKSLLPRSVKINVDWAIQTHN